MSKTGRVNQKLVNGIETSALRLMLTSISFQDYQSKDILIILVETLCSRHKMVEQANYGTSISLQELLDPDQPINHSIFTTQVNPTTCNTTAPAPTGGRCSSTRVKTLSISEMVN